MKRLDTADPVTGGNKSYKLKYNIEAAFSRHCNTLVSFGGAYSNHIAALARMGMRSGLSTIGIIRGEEKAKNNVTLSRARQDGMKLFFVSRAAYRDKIIPEMEGITDYFVITEGGSNDEGIKGCKEILEPGDTYDYIVVGCGTGTTALGIALTMRDNQKLVGISVLKDHGSIQRHILEKLINEKKENLPQIMISGDYHFGGYAKSNEALRSFCNEFHSRTGILIEPVYTGKMFYGIEDLVRKNFFEPGASILAIHTGGLQYLLPSKI